MTQNRLKYLTYVEYMYTYAYITHTSIYSHTQVHIHPYRATRKYNTQHVYIVLTLFWQKRFGQSGWQGLKVKCSKIYAGPTLESKGMHAIFQKRGRNVQNLWKFGQKFERFEIFLKKGRWLREIIAHNKLLEKALPCVCPSLSRTKKP